MLHTNAYSLTYTKIDCFAFFFETSSCYPSVAFLKPISIFYFQVSIDFSLPVKAATLIYISGRGSPISSAKLGKSDSIYNLVKNK